MSSGSSGHIFIFLIQFEFYPTKWSGFEKKNSPPMFLEFDLIFLHIFPNFLSIFSNLNSENQRFLNSDSADPTKFQQFLGKNLTDFLTLLHRAVA
jgi:hypothetical protein